MLSSVYTKFLLRGVLCSQPVSPVGLLWPFDVFQMDCSFLSPWPLVFMEGLLFTCIREAIELFVSLE